MRGYIVPTSTGNSLVARLHSQRRIRAVLELITPQIHEGDNEATAEIFHTGSRESLAIELMRLVIYLATNNMLDELEAVTGYKLNLSDPKCELDFLRNIGVLTQANIDELALSENPTNQAFLERVLALSAVDDKSCDVLSWLVPRHFHANHPVRLLISFYDEGKEFKPLTSGRPDSPKTGTPLQVSSKAANINAIRLLLDLGVDPYNGIGLNCHSPLEYAAASTDHSRAIRITDLMLSAGQPSAWPEAQGRALEDALWPAIANSNIELIKTLFSELYPSTRPTICSGKLYHAAQFADCDTVRFLAEFAPVGDDGSIMLPHDIFVSQYPSIAFGMIDSDSWLSVLDKFQCLLELTTTPTMSRCSNGCNGSCVLEYTIVVWFTDPSIAPRGLVDETEGEDRLLYVAKLLREHGCPPEREEVTTGRNSLPSILQRAIRHGLSRVVEYLLDWGADANYYYDGMKETTYPCRFCQVTNRDQVWGSSPLLTALAHQRTDTAKILLRREPKLKLHGDEFKIVRGINDTELLAMVFQARSEKVDECDWRELLREAIMNRCQRATDLLLSMDIRSESSIDVAITLEAASIGDPDTAYQIGSACHYSSRALYHAVRQSCTSKGHCQLVERLLDARPPAQNDDFEVLAVACAAAQGEIYLLKVLMGVLRQGPWTARYSMKTKEHGTWQLHLNLFTGDGFKVCRPEHIFDIAADIDKLDENKTTIQMLLDFHLPATGMSLDRVVDFVSPETLKQLLKAGADAKEISVFTLVIKRDKLAHAEVLCEAGAPVDTVLLEEWDRTAVQLAAEFANTRILELLLRYGADLNGPISLHYGATCLQIAVGRGYIGMVRLLLHKGAEVNGKRALWHGRTAIEIAAENGRLDILKLLLLQEQHLFRTSAERYQFIRAAKLAEWEGHGPIVKMLRQHISWDNDDQRLFGEIIDRDQLRYCLDEMTQKPLDCERHNQHFTWILEFISKYSRVYDIEDIEQWLGERVGGKEDHYSVDTDDQVSHRDLSAPFLHQQVTRDKVEPAEGSTVDPDLQLDAEFSTENLSVGIHATLVEAGNPALMNTELSREQLSGERHDHGLHPKEQGVEIQAVAPWATCMNETPYWLQMQDDVNNPMSYGLEYDLVIHEGRWEAPAPGLAAQSASQESGMVLGEVLEETQGNHITATIDNLSGNGIFSVAPGQMQQESDVGIDGVFEQILAETQMPHADNMYDGAFGGGLLEANLGLHGEPMLQSSHTANNLPGYDILGASDELDQMQQFDWGLDGGFDPGFDWTSGAESMGWMFDLDV